MITLRTATLDDVAGIRDAFQAEYGEQYPYPQYYDVEELNRLVYAAGTILLVAICNETGRVAGTASVVTSIAAQNDLAGEFGRLVVHPNFRGRGIGKQLMRARIQQVESRLHVGIVENRTSHEFSQRISQRFGFVPVGFIPLKVLMDRRESIAQYVRYFGDALSLRRNNPRIIPEASALAGFALKNCELPLDAIIDDTSAPFPYANEFELGEMKTEGYASLLRIERGRVQQRDVFGPVQLHYGLFQLRARDSHYLIAKRDGQIAGGIGFLIDYAEKGARVFELISVGDEPIRFLLEAFLSKCRTEFQAEYVEINVSAYAPRMQRTLLELGFLPVSYIPANVFHQVERLDAIKMAKLFVPSRFENLCVCEEALPIANSVIDALQGQTVAPEIAAAAQTTPLFAGLSHEQRERLLGICSATSFDANEPLHRMSTTSDTMFLILSGNVNLVDAGKRIIGRIGCGQCVGERALLTPAKDQTEHSLDAIASNAVEAATFRHRALVDLIRRRPDIGVILYRNLAADVSRKLQIADRLRQPDQTLE